MKVATITDLIYCLDKALIKQLKIVGDGDSEMLMNLLKNPTLKFNNDAMVDGSSPEELKEQA